jgi:two-component system, OmpR family, response regulator
LFAKELNVALRVYLVEDNESMRKHLVDSLAEELSVELVGTAETEAEAKDWLERNPDGWDVAILDLFLREGTGAGVLRHCRSRNAGQDVLVMTNYPVSSLLTHCRLLGANAVYDKATELGDLIAYCIGRAGHTSAYGGLARSMS